MSSIGVEGGFRNFPGVRLVQRRLDADADAERRYHAPRRAVLSAYIAALEQFNLDGFVYPAIQMPPPDESMPQDGRVEGPGGAWAVAGVDGAERAGTDAQVSCPSS